MNEKYGWQLNSYGDYDNMDIVDYYKVYCKKDKKEATPKKASAPKTQFNPLLLLVA